MRQQQGQLSDHMSRQFQHNLVILLFWPLCQETSLCIPVPQSNIENLLVQLSDGKPCE